MQKVSKIIISIFFEFSNLEHFFPIAFSKLRSEHRIMGTLVGMIPGFANNNDMNGLPAFYNIYEVYLLLQKKLIMLIDDSHLKNVPSAHQQKSYTEFISGHIQPQEKVKLEKSVKSLSVPLSNDNEHNPELVGIERHDPFIQIPTAHYTFINGNLYKLFYSM